MRYGLVGAGRIGAVHGRTLAAQAGVELAVADVDADRALGLARELGAEHVADVDALLASADALVVTAATSAHASLVRAAVERGLPVFCEKPVAPTVQETIAVLDLVQRTGVPVQIGFQRRFDPGFVAAREAVLGDELGWIHTVRAGTCDAAPPPEDYLPVSGGLFRDCSVHDVDVVHWVTGREVRQVYAVGANHGSPAFAACGDVDAAAALLTLDGDTFALLHATRYNARGYDVRLELLGSRDSVCVGLEDRLPLRSTEPGAAFPAGVPWQAFMERFAPAYEAEMVAFTRVASGAAPSPCTVQDALAAALVTEACELSRSEGRPVDVAEVAARVGAAP